MQPSIKPVNKRKDDDSLLTFDEQDELVINLSRKIEEFDYYDVVEYFTGVDR